MEGITLPPKDYRIGFTGLRQYRRSPAHFLHWFNNPPEATPAMRFGSLYHLMILEPQRFNQEVFILDTTERPEADKGMTSKLNQAWKQAILEANENVITKDEHAALINMRLSFLNNDVARKLVTGGTPEDNIEGEINGLLCRARPDYIRGHAIIELKSTADASPEAFMRHAYSMLYHVQAAYYKEIIEQASGIHYEYFMISQETAAPHPVVVYRLSEELLADGKYTAMQLLDLHRQCMASGKWPGYEVYNEYGNGVFDLNMPKWGGSELIINDTYTR